VNLPSFLWLWKIAAWSMGLALCTYALLGLSGGAIAYYRLSHQPRPPWFRPLHIALGIMLVSLVLLLLAIGIVGTLGHYGSLGHSVHLGIGLAVVGLVLLSALSTTQIKAGQAWARPLHVSINFLLLLGLAGVSLSGWDVVQKYLP
jgi:Protein of unknown function (DUF4079)